MSFEARVAYSPQMFVRSDIGRFISEIEAAGGRTMEEMGKRGVALSKAMAPKGRKRDKRTVRIVDSLHITKLTRTAVQWGSNARHALPQETGSIPHDISGRVRFFWEKENRMWNPGSNTIRHPGNPAHPYLRPAYDQVMSEWFTIARKHYPR